MNELGRPRRSAARQVILLEQRNRSAAAGCVAGNAATVHAAPDDREVEGHTLVRRTQTSLPHTFEFFVILG
jgi:hypothetical protein